MIDSSNYLIQKSLNPICKQGVSGWYAIVNYQPPPSTSTSAGSGSGTSGGTDYNPQYIQETYVVSNIYKQNDQTRIDAVRSQLAALNPPGRICNVQAYWTGDRYVYELACTPPITQQERELQFELGLLKPAGWETTYATRTIPNPYYISPSSPVTPLPDQQVVNLNDKVRVRNWTFVGSTITGTIPGDNTGVQTKTLTLSRQIASMSTVFCGCGADESDCGNCCVRCCNVIGLMVSKLQDL